jgi:hypothetical protein
MDEGYIFVASLISNFKVKPETSDRSSLSDKLPDRVGVLIGCTEQPQYQQSLCHLHKLHH